MKVSHKIIYVVLIFTLMSCGPASKVTAQPETSVANPTSSLSDTTNRSACRSLKLANELATKLDLSNPLVAMLLSDIGQLEAKSGDLDAVRQLLQQVDKQQENSFAIIAKAKITAALATALATSNRLGDAEKVVGEIPDFQSDERCIAFSEIAKLRVAKGDLEAGTRFWKLADQSVANEKDVTKRSESERVIIRSLADAGRIEDAKKRAAGLEARHDDHRGWGPVAESLAIQGDTATAEKIIKSKLSGANWELYQLIAAVAPKGRFIEGRAALQQMDDPALAATACHLLAVALARRGSKDLATLQLKESWSFMDKANLDTAQTGRILLSSIDPSAVLAGIKATLVVCQEFEKRYPPNLAADAYRRLATHCPLEAKEDQIRYLDIAEKLSQKVLDPVEQITCIQDVFRTRSVLLGEEQAIRTAEKITEGLNRGYALLGVAEGRLLPAKK